MGTQELLAHLPGQSLSDAGDRDTRGIAADERARLEIGTYLLQQVLLGLQILDDDLHHPITVPQKFQVVLQVAHRNQSCVLRVIDGAPLGVAYPFLAALGKAVAECAAFGIHSLDHVLLSQLWGNDV